MGWTLGDQPTSMDTDLFVQQLCELNLDEGRAFIQTHATGLGDPAAIAVLIRQESLHQRNINDFASLKLGELLIFFGEYTQHTPSHALGLVAKGDALSHMGHYQAALECLDEAGEEFLQLGDELGWAHTRVTRIIACAWLGRVEEALQAAARAHDVFQQHGEYYRACTVNHNVAVVYTRLGRYQDALNLYDRLLAAYPTLSDSTETVIKQAIAMAEGNKAINLSFLGNFEQAYHLLQQAQAGFTALEETAATVKVEIHLAELDYAQGYYGSALQRYYQARDSAIQDGVDNPMLLVELKLRMAKCLVKLNRVQEACQSAGEAVKASRQFGVSLDTGDALREYASMLVASGRLEEALTALREAWTLFDQGGFDHYASATKLQQAELLLDMGDVTEAYDQAHLIKEYFEAQGLVSSAVRANLVIASSLIKRAQKTEVLQDPEQQSKFLQEATSLCMRTNTLAYQYNLQEQVYKNHYLLGQIAAIQGNLGNTARHYGAAIAQIERILDDLVYDLFPSFLYTTWTVYEDMIALCLKRSQFERALGYLERARSMTLRRYLNKIGAVEGKLKAQEDRIPALESHARSAAMLQIQQELKDWQDRYRKYSIQLVDADVSVSSVVDREMIQAELTQCEVKLSELFERLQLQESDTRLLFHTKRHVMRTENQVNTAHLRQHLSPNQLLLAYFLYQGKLVIFACNTEGLIVHENPDGMAQLEYLLPLLHAHLELANWHDRKSPSLQPICRLLNKLYNILIAPVATLLPLSSGYLTIVPYGPLHNLPFHALFDGSHFLVEDFQINYLPASSMLLHPDIQSGEQMALPLHHDAYRVDTGQAHGLHLQTRVPIKPPLVLGYSDNGHLQRAIDEAKTIATMLGGNCYLERDATIAKLYEQAPGSPIIHLATHGHSRLDAPNFSYVRLADGQLNAIDAFNLTLEGCELVTLSGCETGLALVGGGDEQLGLGRAFLVAGAASLVISLWPVEDNATNELMQIFYQHILRGETKVQALRAAQCSLLHRTSTIYTHPKFWAAFRLVGDIGSVHFRSANVPFPPN